MRKRLPYGVCRPSMARTGGISVLAGFGKIFALRDGMRFF
jgi:hypothetical protein